MLAHRLSQDEIKEICVLAHGKHTDHLKEQLYQLTLDDDRRVAVNALWALTPFCFLGSRVALCQAPSSDRPLHRGAGCNQASVVALPFSFVSHLARKTSVQTLWTYCLVRIADSKSAYAVRAQCIKLAYEQMRYWPELLGELRQALDMISYEPLSPGLRSAWKQVIKKINAAQ